MCIRDRFNPLTYEEAPPLFDLALCDEILQIATDYIGEVPMLFRVQVLWSPINDSTRASQLYHRDGLRWHSKRAKFVFAATDIDENCGPFTFLPADVSERVSTESNEFKMHERLEDDDVYRHVERSEEVAFVGPAESGLAIDSDRCFHFGSRNRTNERLVVMFSYYGSLDWPPGRGRVELLKRTDGLMERYGNDPIRMLAVPDS